LRLASRAEEASPPPLRLQTRVKKSDDANESVCARVFVDSIVDDLSRRRCNGVQFVARPIEVVNGSIVDFDLHWRSTRLG
jgi:hypothetical protein